MISPQRTFEEEKTSFVGELKRRSVVRVGIAYAVIGWVLRVAKVLEGSVRRSGNRVRITAQLINVADGFHIWSDTYDRELADIF